MISDKEYNKLVDAFYDEDYTFIEHVTGKRPKNQPDAEQIILNYKENSKKI